MKGEKEMNRELELAKEKVHITTERGKVYIHIDNAVITSKNFRGLEKRHPEDPSRIVNSEGNRNFSVELSTEVADVISNFRLEGFDEFPFTVSVKIPKKDAEDQTPRIFMALKVSYKYNIDQKGNKMPWSTNPEINQWSSSGRTDITEETVGQIDSVYIEKADLIFTAGRPYTNPMTGKKSLPAYLSQLNYKIKENELNAKWEQDYVTDGPEEFEGVPFD